MRILQDNSAVLSFKPIYQYLNQIHKQLSKILASLLPIHIFRDLVIFDIDSVDFSKKGNVRHKTLLAHSVHLSNQGIHQEKNTIAGIVIRLMIHVVHGR